MKRKTTEEFIKESIIVHGDKYDYSKTDYKNNKTDVCIICKKHGEFWQRPTHHLGGCGCKKCQYELLHNEKFSPYNEFVEKANRKHKGLYIYESENLNYVNAHSFVRVYCKKHGWFEQEANSHLQGHGCKKCSNENVSKKLASDVGEFIEKAKLVHGDKYDYSKVKYVNNRVKVCIVCPKHGEFWQTPMNHLNGENCPNCNSSKMENSVENFLKEHKIDFIRQCSSKHLWFLKKYRIDFYLPNKNIAIECQGEQHYKPILYFGGNDGFKYRKKCDEEKKNLCENNGVRMEYIRYDENVCDRLKKILLI